MRGVAERVPDSAESRVTCYAGLRFLSRYFGRTVAGVALATGFSRPRDEPPTVEEESAKLAGCFKTGVQDVLGPLGEKRPLDD